MAIEIAFDKCVLRRIQDRRSCERPSSPAAESRFRWSSAVDRSEASFLNSGLSSRDLESASSAYRLTIVVVSTRTSSWPVGNIPAQGMCAFSIRPRWLSLILRTPPPTGTRRSRKRPPAMSECGDKSEEEHQVDVEPALVSPARRIASRRPKRRPARQRRESRSRAAVRLVWTDGDQAAGVRRA